MSDIMFRLAPSAPQPVAPRSQFVESDGLVFVTGRLAIDPDDDSLPVPAGIEAQTREVMDNLQRALARANSSLDRVVFARIFLTNFERDFPAMNEIYESYFQADALPGRTTVGVPNLKGGGVIEIDMVARAGLVERGASPASSGFHQGDPRVVGAFGPG